MLTKPNPVRVCAFIDGANLFNWVKRCFGYTYPNFDILRLVQTVVTMEPNRKLVSTHFCIGIPSAADDSTRNTWWTRKLAAMGRSGVMVESRYLKRRELTIQLSGVVNFQHTVPRLQEKGVDLKLGLDMVRLALEKTYDAAILFSQDGDLIEAIVEVHRIAASQRRWVQIECAYPISPGCDSRPIKRTVPRQITRTMYDACIDPTDYR